MEYLTSNACNAVSNSIMFNGCRDNNVATIFSFALNNCCYFCFSYYVVGYAVDNSGFGKSCGTT